MFLLAEVGDSLLVLPIVFQQSVRTEGVSLSSCSQLLKPVRMISRSASFEGEVSPTRLTPQRIGTALGSQSRSSASDMFLHYCAFQLLTHYCHYAYIPLYTVALIAEDDCKWGERPTWPRSLHVSHLEMDRQRMHTHTHACVRMHVNLHISWRGVTQAIKFNRTSIFPAERQFSGGI